MTAEGAGVSERERLARELYRRIYPGDVNTPDSKRTDESDAAEFDRAYATWDAGNEGWAPGTRCREIADALISAGFGDVAGVKAAALEEAAAWLDHGESVGNIGFDGPSNRAEVIAACESAMEDPAEWLRERAKEYRTTDTNGASE